MTSAKAKFHEAIARAGDLTLSPQDFSPKVIEAFEQARRQPRPEGSPAVDAPAASASPQPATKTKGGGSKLPLILVGAAAVVGGGVAVAASGGGASAASSSACRTTTATVSGAILWQPTGANVVTGERLTISASGTWSDGSGSSNAEDA